MGREGFIEIRSTQPIVLASDSWKSVAASAGERAVRCSIVGHSLAKLTRLLKSVCRTSGLAGSFGGCWKCLKWKFKAWAYLEEREVTSSRLGPRWQREALQVQGPVMSGFWIPAGDS